jgi:hypothetical protein
MSFHWGAAREEYPDWAEAVVSGCPPVSEALARSFKEALEHGRRELAVFAVVPANKP